VATKLRTPSLRKVFLALCVTCFTGIATAHVPTPAATASQPTVQIPTPKAGAGVVTAMGSVSSVLNTTLSYLGVRYRFGGNGPGVGGFDCSGLIKKVFGDSLGMNLPRTAAQIAQLGEKVKRDELKPGDLVFFNTLHRTFSHVGIYLGENKFIHAPSTGNVVRIDNITQGYWKKRFTGGRRLLIPDAEAQTTAAAAAAGQGPASSN